MDMSKLKAVVFDLDHTLYDRYGTLRSIAYQFRMDYAARLRPGLTAAALGEIMVCTDREHIYEEGWSGIYRQLCAQEIFLDPPPSRQEWIDYILGQLCRIAVPFPVARPILDHLRTQGWQVALLTNGSVPIQQAKLRLLGLTDAFDEVIITDQVGIHKPDPEVFRIMAKRLGRTTDEMIYVGDHPRNDVDGSRRAGCLPIWVKTSGCWPYPELEKPRYSIHDVTELPDLLRELGELPDGQCTGGRTADT